MLPDLPPVFWESLGRGAIVGLVLALAAIGWLVKQLAAYRAELATATQARADTLIMALGVMEKTALAQQEATSVQREQIGLQKEWGRDHEAMVQEERRTLAEIRDMVRDLKPTARRAS